MRKLLFILTLLPFAAAAQKAEWGLTGGISMNGKASSNMPFTGDNSATNYAFSLRYLRNMGDHLQLGVDMYMQSLASKNASKDYVYQGLEIPKGDSRKIVYAKLVAAPCFIANYKLSVADDAYLYGGAALGLAGTYNAGKKVTSSQSYGAPSGGIGGVGGIQLGAVYGITPRIAVNLEAAMRYYYLTYDATAPNTASAEKLHYSIMSTPITIGIRYRIGFQKVLNYETGRYEVVKPVSKKKETAK